MLVQVPNEVDGGLLVGAVTSVPCSRIANDDKHLDLDGSSYLVTRSREGVDTLKLKGVEKACDQAQCRYLDNYFSDWVNGHVIREDFRRVQNAAQTGVPAAGDAGRLDRLDVKNYIDKSTNPRAVETILRRLGFLSDLDATGRRPYTRVCESVESWIKSGRFVPAFDAFGTADAVVPPADLSVHDDIIKKAVRTVQAARAAVTPAVFNAGTQVAADVDVTGDVYIGANVDASLDAVLAYVAGNNVGRAGYQAVNTGAAGAAPAVPAAGAVTVNNLVVALLGNILARHNVDGKNVVVVRPYVLEHMPNKDAHRKCQLAALAVNQIINRVQAIPAGVVNSVGHGVGPGDAALNPNTYKAKINSVAWCTEFRNYSKFLEVLSRMVAHYNSIVRKAVIQAESVMNQFVNVNYLTMGRFPITQRGGSGASAEHNSLVDEINAMRANAQLTLQTGGYKFPVETLKFKQENNCSNSEQESNNMVGGFHGMMAARQANVALSCDRIKHMVNTHMSVLEGRGYVISNKAQVVADMENYSTQCKETNKLLENLQKLTRLVQSNRGPEDRNIDTREIEKLVKHYNTNAKAMIVSEDQIMALLQTMVQRVADSTKSDGDKQELPQLPQMAPPAAAV